MARTSLREKERWLRESREARAAHVPGTQAEWSQLNLADLAVLFGDLDRRHFFGGGYYPPPAGASNLVI